MELIDGIVVMHKAKSQKDANMVKYDIIESVLEMDIDTGLLRQAVSVLAVPVLSYPGQSKQNVGLSDESDFMRYGRDGIVVVVYFDLLMVAQKVYTLRILNAFSRPLGVSVNQI